MVFLVAVRDFLCVVVELLFYKDSDSTTCFGGSGFMVPYVSIYIWCFLFFVTVITITAMSLWVSFSMDLRLVVLPVMPFAFAYIVFLCAGLGY